MFDVQPQIVLVPSIVPVIVTAVILFLATNGPHNWPALWQELTNPPPDARHATRRPSPNSAYVRLSQAELAMRRAQLMGGGKEVLYGLLQTVQKLFPRMLHQPVPQRCVRVELSH
ncbi:hypothetical protein niasHT_030536 [Heterodera trifolii]|uniref:Uncharacterized protein n=1 Tax=Heterodera trifolii TaxID=157864 RepID=A0ABD2IRA5_9BILA